MYVKSDITQGLSVSLRKPPRIDLLSVLSSNTQLRHTWGRYDVGVGICTSHPRHVPLAELTRGLSLPRARPPTPRGDPCAPAQLTSWLYSKKSKKWFAAGWGGPPGSAETLPCITTVSQALTHIGDHYSDFYHHRS